MSSTSSLDQRIHCCKCELFLQNGAILYTEMNKQDECDECGHLACDECIDYMLMKEWAWRVEELDGEDMIEVDGDWVEYTAAEEGEEEEDEMDEEEGDEMEKEE